MTSRPRPVRNDWSALRVPQLGAWQPELSVSVIVPAYDCQASLDLTLAALSRQTYPADLMEVVIVDDGSPSALHLPQLRPRNCRLVRVAEGTPGWGPANAFHVGVGHSSGEILQRLDADMLAYPGHVEAQARWHHTVPYAVTLGSKRFVDVRPGSPGWPSPADVAATTSMALLFDEDAGEAHDYIEKILRRTDDLRAGDHLTFMVHVGATAALRRELYDAAGGVDTSLHLGEDTEFGYRLAQAGAIFVPERESRSWHLGRTHMMRRAEQLRRYNRPFLADRMPHPRWLRAYGGSGWAVPLIVVVLEVEGRSLEVVRAAVDAILRSDEHDLRIDLVGRWHQLGDERRAVLDDALLDLRLIQATYRSDPRVRLVRQAPDSAFPSPYQLTVPADAGLPSTAIPMMIAEADRHQAGVVRVGAPGGATVELWRTAAVERGRRVRAKDEPLLDAVTEIYGSRTLATSAVGVIDLGAVPVDLLTTGAVTAGARTGRWLPATVEVGGMRTLAQAAVLVAKVSAGRLRTRVRRLASRRQRKDRHAS
jgi:glycosyltransferase involved in cell wall biosynthesis